MSNGIVSAAFIIKARGMKKLAMVLVCVGLLICVFNQTVGAAVGLSGYLIAACVLFAGLSLWVWGRIGAKSHAFDRRVTAGGFLN